MRVRHPAERLPVPEFMGYVWVKGLLSDEGYAFGNWHCETGPSTLSPRNHRYYLGNNMIVKVAL